MLFVRDSYLVIGRHDFDFEDIVRETYAPKVADDDTRLLRFMRAVHGSAEGYYVGMLTAVRDGHAYERLVDRLRYGDLSAYATKAAGLCHSSTSRLLVSAEWASGAELDLDDVPSSDVDHDTALLREDMLEGAGINAALSLQWAEGRDRGDDGILTFEAAFRPAIDSDTAAHLLYRVADLDKFTEAWRVDNGWTDWSGSLVPELPNSVRGSGRYLRSARWSPLA